MQVGLFFVFWFLANSAWVQPHGCCCFFVFLLLLFFVLQHMYPYKASVAVTSWSPPPPPPSHCLVRGPCGSPPPPPPRHPTVLLSEIHVFYPPTHPPPPTHTHTHTLFCCQGSVWFPHSCCLVVSGPCGQSWKGHKNIAVCGHNWSISTWSVWPWWWVDA